MLFRSLNARRKSTERYIQPTPDWSYILSRQNYDTIKNNIVNRKGVGDIDKVVRISEMVSLCVSAEIDFYPLFYCQHELYTSYHADKSDRNKKRLVEAALMIPNQTSPESVSSNTTA